MPELPEVEAARRFVEKHCEGLKIVDATVADDNSDPPPHPFPRSPVMSVWPHETPQAQIMTLSCRDAEVIDDIDPRELEAALKGRTLVKSQRKVRCHSHKHHV